MHLKLSIPYPVLEIMLELNMLVDLKALSVPVYHRSFLTYTNSLKPVQKKNEW